jgi:hypothetical protein|tara:strand:- start:1191 stop:1331 length:141 start_codon:yes stop_codon:yes gene_type:complete
MLIQAGLKASLLRTKTFLRNKAFLFQKTLAANLEEVGVSRALDEKA